MIVLRGASNNNLNMGGPPLATATTEFTVPEMPNGRSDDPLDIGAIEARPVPATPK